MSSSVLGSVQQKRDVTLVLFVVICKTLVQDHSLVAQTARSVRHHLECAPAYSGGYPAQLGRDFLQTLLDPAAVTEKTARTNRRGEKRERRARRGKKRSGVEWSGVEWRGGEWSGGERRSKWLEGDEQVTGPRKAVLEEKRNRRASHISFKSGISSSSILRVSTAMKPQTEPEWSIIGAA
eukprot:3225009-Rhodomonas_salina.7